MGKITFEPTIEGLLYQPLREIETQGGPVLHMMRSDSSFFVGFGEIYFSVVEPKSIKAWKLHRLQTQCFAVPLGLIDVVVYDDREGSSTKGTINTFRLGRPNYYSLLRIPPMLWYGFAAVGGNVAVLANCADIPHDPNESEKLPIDTRAIPYSWNEPHSIAK